MLQKFFAVFGIITHGETVKGNKYKFIIHITVSQANNYSVDILLVVVCVQSCFVYT